MLSRRRMIAAISSMTIFYAAGYIMDVGGALQAWSRPQPAPAPVQETIAHALEEIPQTAQPQVPLVTQDLLPQTLRMAAAETAVAPDETDAPSATDCPLNFTAIPQAEAMVGLSLQAPCAAGETAILTHEGVSFAVTLDADGRADLAMPALAKEAHFEAQLASGETVDAAASVFTADGYDRVALIWDGPAGIELHAFENGAGFADAGHIWSGATADPATAKQGFLTTLGQAPTPQFQRVQIYSSPIDWADDTRRVALMVEAEVTQDTCGQILQGTTMEFAPYAPPVVESFFVDMPDCDALGGFIQLKNMIPELTIAAN